MTTQFTPGPWNYNETTGIVFGGLRGSRIAGVSHECNSMPTKRDRANARLIASAPELLEALKGLVGVLDAMIASDTTTGFVASSDRIRLNIARAAIAKATNA